VRSIAKVWWCGGRGGGYRTEPTYLITPCLGAMFFFMRNGGEGGGVQDRAASHQALTKRANLYMGWGWEGCSHFTQIFAVQLWRAPLLVLNFQCT